MAGANQENGDTGMVTQQRRWISDNIFSALPEFDPVMSTITITQWIDKIEEFTVLYDWDDVAIQHFALSKLKGVAKTWRDSLSRAERTWLDWVDLLKENFPTTTAENILQIKLDAQNYTRAAGQNIIEYFYKKIAKCNLANMDDTETIQWLVRGLVNTRYRDYLVPLTKYQRPSELLPHLITANEYIRDKNENPHGYLNKKPQKSADLKNGQQLSNDQSTRNKTSIICFRCRKTGHTSRECSKKTSIICFRCSKPGHRSSECRNSKSNADETITSTTSQTNGTVLKLGVATQNKYFKNAIINGENIQAYIDMGASCVAMRKSEVDRLGITYDDNLRDEFIGYGFGRVKALGSFKTTIIIDGVNAYVPVSVVPDDVQEIALLVGHPFTEQPHVMITSTAGELIVEQIIPSTAVSSVNKVPLWANTTSVIPKNHVGHISVHTEAVASDLCVEGGLRTTKQLVPRCIISTDERGNTIIPVMNLSNVDFTLNEGEKITRGMKFNEVCNVESNTRSREVNQELITAEEIVTDLDEDLLQKVILLINEYRDLVAKNLRQVGCTHLVDMKLNMKDDEPVVYRPYRLSHHERAQVRDLVKELKEADIVEDSNSSYASPVLLVKKKTGDVRLCVDYRKLNAKTVQDKYPLPRIDDQIDRLHGNVYFTSLDLYSGYYQIPIKDPVTRSRTAFITPDGLYNFKRMPFGVSNGPANFAKMITTALGSLLFAEASAYLDDIVIPSKTVDEGISKLRLVLQALREAGLTIRIDKCRFFMEKIDYLGFEISKSGIEPGKRKSLAVEKFPTPEDVKAVRSFIGLCSYFRRFVKNFALIARPLTNLLSKNVKFKWDEEQKLAFESLKATIVCKPILAMYAPDAYTELHTDACKNGIGAVLLQRQGDNLMHPISYYSRKTTREETNYHSYELEALAIVNSVERFRVYLVGKHFVIKTDCNSLKLLADKRDLTPRIGRWFMKLSEYDYSIDYIKGNRNLAPDALSRNPVESPKETETASLHVFGVQITTDWIASLQRDSCEVSEVIEKINSNDNTVQDKYTIEDGRLYRTTGGRWRLYLPSDLRYEIVSEAHKALSHLRIDKTLAKVKENYYFPKMREFITKYINRCINCLYYKVPNKGNVYWHPLEKGDTPFHTVHLDHIGPFVLTERENKYILTMINGFSKYVVLSAVKDVSAEETVIYVHQFISHYGKPTRFITDRGTAFTSIVFEKFCRDYGIVHVKVSAKSPRSNGQVESINGVIVKCLGMTTRKEDNSDWDIKLMDVQWSLNDSVHKVTKCRPFEVIYNYKVLGLGSCPLSREIELINERKGHKVKNDPTEALQKNKKNEEFKIEARKKRPEKFKEGDLVMVKWDAPASGQSRKLEPKYRGPYIISKVLRFDRYVVKDIPGETVSQRPFSSVVGFDRLKLVNA